MIMMMRTYEGGFLNK